MSHLKITNTKPNKPNQSKQNHKPLSQPVIICQNQSTCLQTKQKLHLKLIVYNSTKFILRFKRNVNYQIHFSILQLMYLNVCAFEFQVSRNPPKYFHSHCHFGPVLSIAGEQSLYSLEVATSWTEPSS